MGPRCSLPTGVFLPCVTSCSLFLHNLNFLITTIRLTMARCREVKLEMWGKLFVLRPLQSVVCMMWSETLGASGSYWSSGNSFVSHDKVATGLLRNCGPINQLGLTRSETLSWRVARSAGFFSCVYVSPAMGVGQSSNKLNPVGYIHMEPAALVLDIAKHLLGIGVEHDLIYFHVYFFENSSGSLCS